MNHLMTLPRLASIEVGILTQAGEEKAPEEHGLHTFISTTSCFLLMNSLRIFNVPYFLFTVPWNSAVNAVEEIVWNSDFIGCVSAQ